MVSFMYIDHLDTVTVTSPGHPSRCCYSMMNKLMMPYRDVNFVFFQKSIIVLKKSILFRLSNLGVSGRRYLAMPRPM